MTTAIETETRPAVSEFDEGPWPTVAIVLFTYEPGGRDTAAETLHNALSRIRYSGQIVVHIADDGSSDAHRAKLCAIASSYVDAWTVTNAQRGGYGRSYNMATQCVHDFAPIVLCLEDDWRLERELDLDPLVRTLRARAGVDSIRLGYLGFTQRLIGEVVHTPMGIGLMLDANSPEPHVFAGHPRIETREYERRVGPWPEGLPAGATEWEVAHRMEARYGVLWPMNLVLPTGDLFVHIGSLGLGEVVPGE